MKNRYAGAWNQVCLEELSLIGLMRRQPEEMAELADMELKRMEIASLQASEI